MHLCKNCSGKGYFIIYKKEDEPNTKKEKTRVLLCSCARGQELKTYFTIKKKYNG